jgi:hypothetical protein
MSGTLVLLGIGFLLMVVLVFLLRKSESASDDPQWSASENSSQFEDRRNRLLDCIFGADDWTFVLNQSSKDVRRLFLRERKEIALWWLSEIRGQARAAMRFHLANARKSEKLQPMQELKLAVDYFSIRVKCGLIGAMLLLQGPVALRGLVRQAGGLSDQLRGLLEVVTEIGTLQEKASIPD